MAEVPDSVRQAVAALAAAPVLLVASDFDGVLAPLVLDPSTSRPLPGTIDDLVGLAALPDTYAAVVSGRDLETLTALTGLEDSAVTRIGSHGGESSATAGADLDADERTQLEALVGELSAVASEHDGSYLEHKPTAVVMHTRRMDGAAAGAAEDAALKAAGRHTGVHVMQGKHVVEVSVVRADKGSALIALRDAVGATAVAYLGDDVTDEDAFVLLGEHDLAVKVGDGPTAAAHRVKRPDDAAAVLALLRELRTRRSS